VVSWTPVAGATSYNLYWKTSAGVTVATGTKVLGVKSPHTHAGLQKGTTYYYIVTALGPGGESTPSGEASATAGGVVKPDMGLPADQSVPPDMSAPLPDTGVTGYGAVSSNLTKGAYGLIALTNTYTGAGKIEVYVFTSDPKISGKAILGLTVIAPTGGAVSGKLTPNSKTGAHTGLTTKPLLPGNYTFTVSGAVSGTISAKVNKVPTCAVTKPIAGSTHTAGQNLTITWLSSNSQRATYLLTDNKGTVIPKAPLQPDPGGIIINGKDIPYASPLDIKITAAWSAKAVPNTGGIVCAAEGWTKITLK